MVIDINCEFTNVCMIYKDLILCFQLYYYFRFVFERDVAVNHGYSFQASFLLGERFRWFRCELRSCGSENFEIKTLAIL